MKIFQKVRCKGYVKKFYDGVYIQFFYPDGEFCYDKTVTDYKARAVAYKLVPESSEPVEIKDLSEFDGDSVEKVWRKRVDADFTGVLVGFTTVNMSGYIGTDWCDNIYGEEYGFCFKEVVKTAKVGVVYFKNNVKRYVLEEDIEVIE